MKLRKLITEERYQRGTRLLEGVVAMLAKMIRASTVASTSTSPSPFNVVDHDYDHVDVNAR